MAITADAIITTLMDSFERSKRRNIPYAHWFLDGCLPPEALKATLALPFEAPSLGGISGRREVHNATRKYFDVENRARFPIVRALADGLQDDRITRAVERLFDTSLDESYLRIEFAQDTDGFWLEPHTDLGVKLFTFLLYLSPDASHATLGTDIYDSEKRHVGRSPFAPNTAMAFVPSAITYHGFEPRKIEGVRKSVIINYVTSEWQAREQLAFPDRPVRRARSANDA